MPKSKGSTKPRRNRKGYVMVEMNGDHRIALNWLLAQQERLLGEKQQAAPFIRQMLWRMFVSEGGLEELSSNFFDGLDRVKTAPYIKGVGRTERDAEPRT